MKIILTQDVPGIGRKYEVKNVSDGYARNFIIPRKLGQIATTQAIQSIEKSKKQTEQEREVMQNILDKNIKSLAGVKVVIKEKANEKGHLFSIVHVEEISKAIKEQHGLDIPAKLIEIAKPVKETGPHKVKVKNQEFELEVLAS